MTSEKERRHKRAHWRACRRLIEAHPVEFGLLLAEERGEQQPAARVPLPTREQLRQAHEQTRSPAV